MKKYGGMMYGGKYYWSLAQGPVLSQLNQASILYFFGIKLMLPSHLLLGSSSALIPLGFPAERWNAFLNKMRTACWAYLISFDFMALIVFNTANFCEQRVLRGQRNGSPRPLISIF
jgi:hypothetical protein